MSLSYYITDRHSSSLPILEHIQNAIEAGVDYLQIREKDLSSRELYDLACAAKTFVHGRQTKILVNDRVDIALAAGLDGVHLGRQSIDPDVIRAKITKEDFVIGVSTHTIQEIGSVHKQGVNFLTFGPVYYTPSKSSFAPPVGPSELENACSFSRVPVFALGGISRENYLECLKAGAAGVAAIRMFQQEWGSVKKIIQEIRSIPFSTRSSKERFRPN